VLSIFFILMFIVFYQLSIGPLLWIYMSEIMTEKGLSIGATITWITTLNIGTFASEVIKLFGDGDVGSGRLFLVFGLFSTTCGLFCLFVLKETKGLSEKEVAMLYSKDKKGHVALGNTTRFTTTF